MTPKLFKGDISQDTRGSVSFNNNLILKNIKRFYKFIKNIKLFSLYKDEVEIDFEKKK